MRCGNNAYCYLLLLVFVLRNNNNDNGVVLSFTSSSIPQTTTTRRIVSSSIYSKKKETSTYEETDVSSKGFVSGLTGLVNMFLPDKDPITNTKILVSPVSTPEELLERISKDYTENNYLWTGDIDLDCFEENCKFTDPTISFTSTTTFVKNTQNLKLIVDKVATNTQSKLLSINLTEDYVESRWNMIGDLTGLPWKPQINVIGRTKFWYNNSTTTTDDDDGAASSSLRVYFYDESWEVPASEALLQLFQPGVYN